MKVGENLKTPYPQCGRSIKPYARGNNDAPSITKYGSPVRLDAPIVALRPHCAKVAHYLSTVLAPDLKIEEITLAARRSMPILRGSP